MPAGFVYKKFKPEDFSYTPFNANKQYNFNSSSASTSKIKNFSAKYTSESISLYSSASTVSIWSGQTGSFDPINTIKYNQLDHLYYRDFKKDLSNKFGDWHYLKQKRTLYENVNILSIPAGLYGHQIKKGEFFLSSSNLNFSQSNGGYSVSIKDDGDGNLIDSSLNLSNFETDIRKNILNIGPVKGFKRYDLGTYDGYVKIDGYDSMTYWRRGKENPNAPFTYTSFDDLDEFDDSYYFNDVKYKNVRFIKQPLFIRKSTGSINTGGYPDVTLGNTLILEGDYFPSLDMGVSEVRLGNDDKFNFNPNDNFTISFWFKNSELENGWTIEGSAVYDDEFKKQYVISKSTTKKIISPNKDTNDNLSTTTSDNEQTKDTFAEEQFPFEVYMDESLGEKHIFFQRSDGERTITISGSLAFTDNNPFMHNITCVASESIMKVYVNGIETGSIADTLFKHTENTADIFIGNQGGFKNHFNGSLSQINIFNKALLPNQIVAHYSSSNGSPYAGNIFYSHCIATITHPRYIGTLSEYNSPPQEDQLNLNLSTQFFHKNAIKLDDLEGSYNLKTVKDVAFKPDGTRMYVLSGQGDDSSETDQQTIKAYELTTPWSVTSAQFLSEISPSVMRFTLSVNNENGTTFTHAPENEPRAFDFHRDGNHLVFVGQTNKRVYELNFSNPWDISTVTSVSRSISMSNFSDNGGPDPLTGNISAINGTKFTNQNVTAIRYGADGGKLFVGFKQNNSVTNRLAEIKLGNQYDVGSFPTFTDSSDVCIECKTIDLESITSNTQPNSHWENFDFNSSGNQLVVSVKNSVGSNSSRLYQVYLTSSFNINSFVPSGYYGDLPAGSEQQTKFQGVRWEEVSPAVSKDSRIYVASEGSNSSTEDNHVGEYHFKKASIDNLKFKGNHLIFEHEYRCSIEEGEYLDTLNPTARKIPKTTNEEPADFTTGSLFRPYVTTIGLYNENNELLVVGKLGQPIRMSDETDSHFIVKWDT